MTLAAFDLPSTIDLPAHGEMEIDPATIDQDLLKRMNQAALDVAADDLVDTARLVIDRPARNEEEADANALLAAHLMLAATLTRNGSL